MNTPPPLPGSAPEIIEEIVVTVEPPVNSCPPPIPHAAPARQPDTTGSPMPPTYLVWNLIACIACVITGIIGLVFGSQVGQCYRQGDMAGARKASANARLMLLASVVMGLVNVPFLLLYWALT